MKIIALICFLASFGFAFSKPQYAYPGPVNYGPVSINGAMGSHFNMPTYHTSHQGPVNFGHTNIHGVSGGLFNFGRRRRSVRSKRDIGSLVGGILGGVSRIISSAHGNQDFGNYNHFTSINHGPINNGPVSIHNPYSSGFRFGRRKRRSAEPESDQMRCHDFLWYRNCYNYSQARFQDSFGNTFHFGQYFPWSYSYGMFNRYGGGSYNGGHHPYPHGFRNAHGHPAVEVFNHGFGGSSVNIG